MSKSRIALCVAALVMIVHVFIMIIAVSWRVGKTAERIESQAELQMCLKQHPIPDWQACFDEAATSESLVRPPWYVRYTNFLLHGLRSAPQKQDQGQEQEN